MLLDSVQGEGNISDWAVMVTIFQQREGKIRAKGGFEPRVVRIAIGDSFGTLRTGSSPRGPG